MRRLSFGVLLFWLAFACERKPDEATHAPSCIDEKLVAALFKEIRRKGAWDPSGPLLWAYYFEDREEQPLLALRGELESSGYDFVELMSPERVGQAYVLHVSRLEKHTAESLNERNRKLCRLSRKLKVDAYKGMDVGPSTPPSMPDP